MVPLDKWARKLWIVDSATGKERSILFDTPKEKLDYVSHTKALPGDFGFDERVKFFNRQAANFEEFGVYCEYVDGTQEWEDFWDHEKELSYTGLMIDNDFYTTGDHYFYLNYASINDKVKGKFALPRFQDLDVWAYNCVEETIASEEFLSILKARQTGFSLKFIARLIKRMYFEEAFMGRIAAYEEKYVDIAFSQILTPYRKHLNEHTAWIRHFQPSDAKIFWKQGFKNGRGDYDGDLSEIRGVTTKVNPSAVVAGPVSEAVYDEAGLSLNLIKSHGFVVPAMKFGDQKTGNFFMLGAAGEAKESSDLVEIIKNPALYRCKVFNVPSWSREGIAGTGMFVPYYYSYGSCIDAFGNSLIEKAKEHYKRDAELEKQKSPQDYAIFKAQFPEFIEDATTAAGEGRFPNVDEIMLQIDRVKNILRAPALVKLDYDRNGKVYHSFLGAGKPVRKKSFGKKNLSERIGAIEVVEFPAANPEQGLYYVGIDPIRAVKSVDPKASLMAVYVYKAKHMVDGEFGGDELVAWYYGRHDDYLETFKVAKMMIQWYNARAAIENDQISYIEWLQKEQMQGHVHIMRRSEMPFLADLVIKSTIDNSEYGFRTGAGPVKGYIEEVISEYISEVIATKTVGEEEVPVYGVTRIRDIMLLEDMVSNGPLSDRLIAFGAALMVARANTNRGVMARKKAPPPSQVKTEIGRTAESNYQQKTKTRSPMARRTVRSPFLR